MKLLSKIAFFFLFIIITISFIYCSKDETMNQNTIPYTRMYAEIDFRVYNELYSINTPATVNKYGVRLIGYNGHGIFISKINSDEYSAFDRTCPNHGDDFSNVLEYTKGDLFYHCKECGAKYNFINGYATKDLNPQNTENRIIPKLQEYNTRIINDYTLRVTNIR